MPTPPRRRRWFLWIAFIAFALLVVGGFWRLIDIVHTSLEAEYTELAYCGVLEALESYVSNHPGEWPKNWEELAAESHEVHGNFELPDNLSDTKRRVFVDFDLTTEDVSKMAVEGFPAVRPCGPNYGDNPTRIHPLIEAAKVK